MVPAGNKVKRLSSVNHIAKTMLHHHRFFPNIWDQQSETYSESCQTFKIERFEKIVAFGC